MTKDLVGGAFGLVISLIIIQQSLSLGLGTIHSPGTGFFPFICADILALLSGAIILRPFLHSGAERDRGRLRIDWAIFYRLGLMVVVLLIYAFIFPYVGFFLATFLLLLFLYRNPQHKWWVTLWEASATTLGSYLLFKVLLEIQFPIGFLGI
jgi:hypothetical protein